MPGHRVRFAPLRMALAQGHYMRVLGIRGSKAARKENRKDYNEYKAKMKRGHKIKKAHRRRR